MFIGTPSRPGCFAPQQDGGTHARRAPHASQDPRTLPGCWSRPTSCCAAPPAGHGRPSIRCASSLAAASRSRALLSLQLGGSPGHAAHRGPDLVQLRRAGWVLVSKRSWDALAVQAWMLLVLAPVLQVPTVFVPAVEDVIGGLVGCRPRGFAVRQEKRNGRKESYPGRRCPLRSIELPERLLLLVTEQRAILSWGWLGLQRICAAKLATLLVSSLPLWPLLALAFEVFASARAQESITLLGDPLVTFHSPPEYSRSGAVGQAFGPADILPCGFFPFSVLPESGSHSSRSNQLRVSVPSQRFSRSQGLDPPESCRPSFMPVPLMGFPFRADFHPQSSTFSRTPVPSCGWSENLHFRVLLPASVLVSVEAKLERRQRPSWASPP